MIKYLYAILLLFTTSCGTPSADTPLDRWLQETEKARVLCTIGMIGDLVTEVGGDRINCITLINGQLDPHTYELVKGDDEKLLAADLIFYNGLGLEHGPSLRQYLDDCKNCTAIGNYIAENDASSVVYVGGQLDPHIWTDLSLYARGVDAMVERLSAFDPEGASYFRENGDRLQREMLERHDRMRAMLQAIPESARYLVSSHDAFNYFARAYLSEPTETTQEQWQMRVEAPEGLSPESMLSPLDIQRLIDHLKTYNITVLFPESNVSQDSIRKIVDAGRKAGLDLSVAQEHLYADAKGGPGTPGDTYLNMMEHNAMTIAHHLNGTRHHE